MSTSFPQSGGVPAFSGKGDDPRTTAAQAAGARIEEITERLFPGDSEAADAAMQSITGLSEGEPPSDPNAAALLAGLEEAGIPPLRMKAEPAFGSDAPPPGSKLDTFA